MVSSSCKKSLAVESTRTSSFAQLLVLADSTAKDFMQQDGTILVEIVRALYGLPDSAKRWNSHFTSVLTTPGGLNITYVQCDSELTGASSKFTQRCVRSCCQHKMYESRVVTEEVEDSRKLNNKLYEN